MRPVKRATALSLMLSACLMLAPLGAGAAYETLRPWAIGSEVRQMQEALTALGYKLKVDGTYGPKCEAAVRDFQGRHGLQKDGIAGDQTLTLLYSLARQAAAPAEQGAEASPVYPAGEASVTPKDRLELGSNSPAVAQLQNALIARGFAPGRNDGSFDAATREAVKAFQKSEGLSADGIAGPLTLSRLQGAAAQEPVSTPAPALSGGQALGQALVATGNSGSLRLRATASAADSRNVIGSLSNGQQVELLGQTGIWSHIRLSGQEGYVMTRYLKASAPSSAPSSEGGGQAAAPAAEAGSGFSRILRPGDSGEDVLRLQQRLTELSYAPSLNGSYDSATAAAVRAFQSANGLKADGVFGSGSAGALASSAAKAAQSAPQAPSALRLGDQGEAVSRLQKRLSDLGFSLSADGSFGAQTQQAVAAFQRQNSLSQSGIADENTQAAIYASDAKKNSDEAPPAVDLSEGRIGGPAAGSVRLMHWYQEVKPALSGGSAIRIYHPASGVSFNLKVYSTGRHADAEPKTLKDTQLMNGAFGPASWDTRPVYVQLPGGAWTLATMHNYPHLSGSISDNGFNGHLCVHFLRDLDETKKHDPNYGMQNQLAIRKAWKSMTGEVVE